MTDSQSETLIIKHLYYLYNLLVDESVIVVAVPDVTMIDEAPITITPALEVILQRMNVLFNSPLTVTLTSVVK